MVITDEIIDGAVAKAAEFIANAQEKDGSWKARDSVKRPNWGVSPLMATVDGIETLCLANDIKYIRHIERGLNFCLNYELHPIEDNLVLWAWKLRALSYINTIKSAIEKEKIVKFLKSKHNKDGSWEQMYPLDPLWVCFMIYGSFLDLPYEHIERVKDWFLKIKAKDGIGWGEVPNAEKSELSRTCTASAIISFAGVNIDDPQIRKIRKFVEDSQNKDGSWSSFGSNPSVWGTSVAIRRLLCFSNKITLFIEKGVKFLLDAQNEDGSWYNPHKAVGDIYTTYYAVKGLAYYKNVKNAFKSKNKYFKKLLGDNFCIYTLHRASLSRRQNVQQLILKDIMNSPLFGNTSSVIERRKEIIDILSREGEKDVAGMIDSLKKIEKYKRLSKKSHMTQITYDLEHLRDLNIIRRNNRKYFLIIDPNEI